MDMRCLFFSFVAARYEIVSFDVSFWRSRYRCDLSAIDCCFIRNLIERSSFCRITVFGERKNIRLRNHHLSLFQKSYVKAESINVGLPFAARGLRVTYCIHSQRSELSLRIKKNQFAAKCWCMSIAPRSVVWSQNFFYHGGEKGAIALAPPASRQVENRSSAIYRDCQRAFEQSSVPSASDSFCRIFQKSRKADRGCTRDL